ncbi:MAG: hypothetical protein ACPLQO_07740, partial [Desulfotomaculales bacterium]
PAAPKVQKVFGQEVERQEFSPGCPKFPRVFSPPAGNRICKKARFAFLLLLARGLLNAKRTW